MVKSDSSVLDFLTAVSTFWSVFLGARKNKAESSVSLSHGELDQFAKRWIQYIRPAFQLNVVQFLLEIGYDRSFACRIQYTRPFAFTSMRRIGMLMHDINICFMGLRDMGIKRWIA